MSTTFSQKKVVSTFRRRVHFAIPPPPQKADITGYIEYDGKVKSKAEITELRDRNLTDEEYFAEICTAVYGLGHPESDEELTGQAALDEATTGRYSMYLVNGIVNDYFEHYGEGRRGNSKGRR